MRLGTKILILTLAITLALAGIIVWVVSRDITDDLTERAHADIRRAVTNYFAQIDSLHRDKAGKLKVLMDDPQNRAQLEAVGDDNAEAREHFKLLLPEFFASQSADE